MNNTNTNTNNKNLASSSASVIFSKYINNNNNKLIPFKIKNSDIGRTRYFPPISKEWKNSIYVFNHNNLKNLPLFDININSLIKDYFNLQFKDKILFKKKILSKVQVVSLNKIYASKAEIKHTNTKAILTVYTFNREKISLYKKIKKLKKSFYFVFDKIISFSERVILSGVPIRVDKDGKVLSNLYLPFRLRGVLPWITKSHVNIWRKIIIASLYKELILLRKYKLRLDLNKYKFEEKLLYRLNNLIMKYYNKKVEFNIVNMRSFLLNSDILTKILALKLKNRNARVMKIMDVILNKANLPKINRVQEKASLIKSVDLNLLENKFKNLNLSFILNDASYAERNNLSELLNKLYYNVLLVSQKGVWALRSPKGEQPSFHSKSGGSPTKFIQKGAGAASLGGNAKAQPKVSSFAKAKKYAKIYQIIFNSINYKNMGGLRLEIKGRLTKRYRADRSLFKVKWKGGLKNLDSSYKGLSSVNMRGYAKPNVEYSIFTTKRRIGAFAVKGWVSGK